MAMKEKRFHFHIADENDYEQIYETMLAIYKNKNQEIFEKEMMNRSDITKLVTLINKHIFMDMGPKKVTHVNRLLTRFSPISMTIMPVLSRSMIWLHAFISISLQ